MTSAMLTCVHAGRRVKKTSQRGKGRKPQGRRHRGKGGGGQTKEKTKNKKQNDKAPPGGCTAQSEQATGERVGASGADEGPLVARGETKTQVTRWGRGMGTVGSGGVARTKGPHQVLKKTNHPNKRRRDGSDPCKAHKTVPGWNRIQRARATGLLAAWWGMNTG